MFSPPYPLDHHLKDIAPPRADPLGYLFGVVAASAFIAIGDLDVDLHFFLSAR
jgi:hypothetical protein